MIEHVKKAKKELRLAMRLAVPEDRIQLIRALEAITKAEIYITDPAKSSLRSRRL